MVKLMDAEKKQAAAEKHVEDKAKKAPVKEEKAKKVEAKFNLTLDDLGLVLYPLVTEKAVNMIEAENKITFVVSDKATKVSVKKVIETAYNVKVVKINIVRDMRGRKKAIVKLAKENKAQDLATKLGVL